MVMKVVHRHVCQTHDFVGVREWCERIIGPYGWGVSMEIDATNGRFTSTPRPVIVVYDHADKSLEQIKLLIALSWS